ncbi:MAG: hypothetical protein KDJ73_10020 [Notoacmeibacter sp.]|nr:hypothetical protein [Notoacmeibacter sp.]
MKIFTSSWSTPMPESIVRIGISRGTPRNQSGYKMLPALAPGPWFKTASPKVFEELYREQLAGLDPEFTVARIRAISEGRDAALLCWEDPNIAADWCHRGMVSEWLQQTLGIEVYEYGLEQCGCGLSHPKLYRAELVD